MLSLLTAVALMPCNPVPAARPWAAPADGGAGAGCGGRPLPPAGGLLQNPAGSDQSRPHCSKLACACKAAIAGLRAILHNPCLPCTCQTQGLDPPGLTRAVLRRRPAPPARAAAPPPPPWTSPGCAPLATAAPPVWWCRQCASGRCCAGMPPLRTSWWRPAMCCAWRGAEPGGRALSSRLVRRQLLSVLSALACGFEAQHDLMNG